MDTWTLIDHHSHYGINLSVFRSQNAAIEGPFDLGIFFGTFESRGLVSSTLLQKSACNQSIVIFFKDSQDKELRQRYDPILGQQVQQCTVEPFISVKDVSIKDVEGTLSSLFSSIPLSCWGLDARWFVDMGGSPIPYFLGLMAYLRDLFPCPKLTFFNPTGCYDKRRAGFTFTYGFDRNIWVPRLWGRIDPTLPKTYVFLLGFNGNRSYEVFHHCEPDKVLAMIGNPGYEQGYEQRPLEENEMFLRESGLWANDDILPKVMEADAANPAEVWRQLQKVVSDEQGKSNVCFVPTGPKGHALGAGLCAMANGAPSVLYHLPRTFNVRDSNRGAYIWKYEVSL